MAPRLEELPLGLQQALLQQHPELARRKTKPRKYRNQVVVGLRGVVYESELERQTAAELALLLKYAKIRSWAWGPRYVLQQDPDKPNTLITYRPDFVVEPLASGYRVDGTLLTSWFVIDAKGRRTAVFNTKARQWKVKYPDVPLVLVTRDGWKLA